MKRTSGGFTIVELLIAILIISILVGLVIMTYSGIQQGARDKKVSADLQALNKSINVARIAEDKTLLEITQSNNTYIQCFAKPTGTDLAALPKTDQCWVNYYSALEKISAASGSSIVNLVDPWGRPYYINENEGDHPGTPCTQDRIAVYRQPFVHNQYASTSAVLVLNSLLGC